FAAQPPALITILDLRERLRLCLRTGTKPDLTGSALPLLRRGKLRSISNEVNSVTNEDQPRYLWKHALVLSSLIALIATVLVWGFGLLSTPEPKHSAGLGGKSEPFAAVPRQDLEAIYHQAWQTVGQNYIDQPKLHNWQSWEHKFDGQIRTERQLVAAIQEMLA